MMLLGTLGEDSAKCKGEGSGCMTFEGSFFGGKSHIMICFVRKLERIYIWIYYFVY